MTIFNERKWTYFIRKTFETMVIIGPVAKSFAKKRSDYRIKIAEKRHMEVLTEARRNANTTLNEYYEEEGVVYGLAVNCKYDFLHFMYLWLVRKTLYAFLEI